MRKLLLIALILVIAIIPCASAYTIHSVYNRSTTTSGSNSVGVLTSACDIRNTTDNMTALNIDGYLYDYGRPSMTSTGTWHVGSSTGIQVATGSISWSTTIRESYFATAQINYTFDNWNIGVFNGSLNLYFHNDTPFYDAISYDPDTGFLDGGYYEYPLIRYSLGGGAYALYGGSDIPPGPPTPDYTCNFNDAFPYVGNPFDLQCTDNSTAEPAVTSVDWILTQPDSTTFEVSNDTLVRTLTQDGWYGLDFAVCNIHGCGHLNTTTLVNVTSGTAPSAGIQTYFQAIDGQTGSPIGGAEIQLQDVVIGSWTNTTSGPDGTSSIITNSTTTINAYAQYGDYTAGTRLGVSPCLISGTCLYEIVLFPGFMLPAPGSGLPGDPGVGNINLVVTVTDYETKQGIYMAQVRVADAGGNITSSYTNDAGTKVFAVPNSSTVYIEASKTGYTGQSRSLMTSAFGPDTAYFALFPATGGTVTSTPTPIYTDSEGHIIAPEPTLSTSAQDDALMNQLREAGPGLINLCIIAVALGILKMILKF